MIWGDVDSLEFDVEIQFQHLTTKSSLHVWWYIQFVILMRIIFNTYINKGWKYIGYKCHYTSKQNGKINLK